MKTVLFIFFFVIAFSFFSSSNLSAQTTTPGHLYTMTMIQIPNDQMKEFMDFFEKDGKPLDAENEYILGEKVYTHAWGPSWNVCLVTEYKDWEGFVAAEKRGNEIFNAHYPDKTKRDEIGKKWGGYLNNHTDAIVFDHPNLAK